MVKWYGHIANHYECRRQDQHFTRSDSFIRVCGCDIAPTQRGETGSYAKTKKKASKGIDLCFDQAGAYALYYESFAQLDKKILVFGGVHFHNDPVFGGVYGGALPFDLTFALNRDEVRKKLGPQDWVREIDVLPGDKWHYPDLDKTVLVSYYSGSFTIRSISFSFDETAEMMRGSHPSGSASTQVILKEAAITALLGFLGRAADDAFNNELSTWGLPIDAVEHPVDDDGYKETFEVRDFEELGLRLCFSDAESYRCEGNALYQPPMIFSGYCFFNGDPYYNTGRYTGEMPHGLQWADSVAVVSSKLGETKWRFKSDSIHIERYDFTGYF